MRFYLLLMLFPASLFAADEEGILFFEKKVRGLLQQHCYECHSADAKKLRGGLYLDSREGWMAGGETGPVIVPGKPEESRLLKAVSYKDHDLKMPKKYKLKPHEIEVLTEWVQRGAPDPRSGGEVKRVRETIDLDKGREFWSFRPRWKGPAPKVRDAAWPESDIDRFLLARIEEAGLKPAEDADRETLARRVYFDLIGLPPTPEQIDAFVSDTSKDALARLIDRLLASPEFGERWGRHWLDITRFAESSGGGRSLMFKNAWRFRDYMIDAVNRDKPYDQLIRECIAGDLLPFESDAQRNEQVVASGYLVLGPTNYEQQDKALLEMEVVDEQIDTIGRTFMAMTLGCARCHEHKFDPIPMEDYYAMAGIFKSTTTLTPGNVSGFVTRDLVDRTPKSEKVIAHEKQVAELSMKLEAAKKVLATFAPEPKPVDRARGIPVASLPGIVIDDQQAKKIGRWKLSTHSAGYVGGNYIHDESVDKGKKSVEYTPKIEQGGHYEVRVSYTPSSNRPTNTPVHIDHTDGRTTVRINQVKDPEFGSFTSVGTYRFEADTVVKITISNEGTQGAVIADAVQLLRKGDPVAKQKPSLAPPLEAPKKTESPKLAKERKAADQLVKQLDKQIRDLKKKNPAPEKQVAMSIKDVAKPSDGHLHIRGGVRNLGPIIPRGFLQVMLPSGQPMPEIPAANSGRLELAEWLSRPEHPLTARVMVNRIWHHVFGVGIVRTTDNFGETGERPSHPELLDHLADRFVAEGWSTKKLVRELMLTRAYRMRASAPTGQGVDPENRLLAHANRKRLEAECIRDAMLATSGKLDPAGGGYTIRKFSQYDLGYAFDTRKRSVYVPAFRNSILEIFDVFDAANPNLVTGRRNVSTLPTQSLYLMNSPEVQGLAGSTAKRIMDLKGNDEERLEYLYRLLLGRRPGGAERIKALAFVQDEGAGTLAGWTGLCHALYACIDFRYLN